MLNILSVILTFFYLSTVSTGIMLHPRSPRPDHTWGVRLSLTILSCLLTRMLTDRPWVCWTTVLMSCRDFKFPAFTEPNSTIRSSTQMPWEKTYLFRMKLQFFQIWICYEGPLEFKTAAYKLKCHMTYTKDWNETSVIIGADDYRSEKFGITLMLYTLYFEGTRLNFLPS